METAKNFLADQTKQGGKGKKTRPQEALAKVHLPLLAPFWSKYVMYQSILYQSLYFSSCSYLCMLANRPMVIGKQLIIGSPLHHIAQQFQL